MEEKSTPIWKVSLNYGLITGVLAVIFSLILYVLDLNKDESTSWLNVLVYLIFIGGMIWSAKSYRDLHNNGLLSYGQGFSASFLTGLFATILVGIFVFFLYSYDDTILKEQLIRAEEGMYEKGYTDEQIEVGMEWSRMFSTPAVSAIASIVWNTIIAVVISLILAIFTKKEETSV